MKKIGLTVFSVICAVCMMFGILSITSVNTAANADYESVVVLSKTAFKKSKSNDKLMLVTAIKNYTDVYEVGYHFGGAHGESVETISAPQDKYYKTIIASSEKTWRAENIFGSDFEGAGMIIWEIVYDSDASYTIQAYAKYGKRNEENQLVTYDPEREELGTEGGDTETCLITFVNEDGSALTSKRVTYGSMPTYDGIPTQSADETYAYAFKGWDTPIVTATGNATYTATYDKYDISGFSVDVENNQKLLHKYDVDITGKPEGLGMSVSGDGLIYSDGQIQSQNTGSLTMSVNLISDDDVIIYVAETDIDVSVTATSTTSATYIDTSSSNALTAGTGLSSYVNMASLTGLYDVTSEVTEIDYSAGTITDDSLTLGERTYAALTNDNSYLVDVVVADYVVSSKETMKTWSDNSDTYHYVVMSQDFTSTGPAGSGVGSLGASKDVPDGFTFNGLGHTMTNVYFVYGLFSTGNIGSANVKNLTINGVYVYRFSLFGVLGDDPVNIENVNVYDYYTNESRPFTETWGAMLAAGERGTTLTMTNCYIEYTGSQDTMWSLISNNSKLILNNTAIVREKGELAYALGERGAVTSSGNTGVTAEKFIVNGTSYVTDSRGVRLSSGIFDNPTITFENQDGTTLKEVTVNYGKVPTYSGTPTQTQSGTTAYAFTGWDKSFAPAFADATYTANYDSIDMSGLSVSVTAAQKLLHKYDVDISGEPAGLDVDVIFGTDDFVYSDGQVQSLAPGSGIMSVTLSKNGATVYVVNRAITVSAVTTDYSRTTIINVASSNAINEVSADHVVPWASVTALYDVTDGIANKSAVAFSNGAITADLSSTFGEKKYIALTADNTYLVDVVLADYIMDNAGKNRTETQVCGSYSYWRQNSDLYHYVVVANNFSSTLAASNGVHTLHAQKTLPEGFVFNGLGCTLTNLYFEFGMLGDNYFSNVTIKNVTFNTVYVHARPLFGRLGVGILTIENVNVYTYFTNNTAGLFESATGAMLATGDRYSDSTNYPRLNMKNCYIEYTGSQTAMWSLCSNNCKLTLDNTTIVANNGTLAKYIGEKGSVTSTYGPTNTGVTADKLILTNGSSITDSRGTVTSITANPNA